MISMSRLSKTLEHSFADLRPEMWQETKVHQLAAHRERAAHRWNDANIFRPSCARTRYVDAWVGRV